MYAAMNLSDYLEKHGNHALARTLGVSSVVVSLWRTASRQVPAERCPAIEDATDGAVRCEDLRPDINWAVLRNSDCPDREVA